MGAKSPCLFRHSQCSVHRPCIERSSSSYSPQMPYYKAKLAGLVVSDHSNSRLAVLDYCRFVVFAHRIFEFLAVYDS